MNPTGIFQFRVSISSVEPMIDELLLPSVRPILGNGRLSTIVRVPITNLGNGSRLLIMPLLRRLLLRLCEVDETDILLQPLQGGVNRQFKRYQL